MECPQTIFENKKNGSKTIWHKKFEGKILRYATMPENLRNLCLLMSSCWGSHIVLESSSEPYLYRGHIHQILHALEQAIMPKFINWKFSSWEEFRKFARPEYHYCFQTLCIIIWIGSFQELSRYTCMGQLEKLLHHTHKTGITSSNIQVLYQIMSKCCTNWIKGRTTIIAKTKLWTWCSIVFYRPFCSVFILYKLISIEMSHDGTLLNEAARNFLARHEGCNSRVCFITVRSSNLRCYPAFVRGSL